MTASATALIRHTSAVRPDREPPRLSDHRRFAMMGYLAVAMSFGAFGLWAALAPLGSAVIANGQVAVSSDRKPIQHLEGGIVREILVREAQRVKQGQVLFRLLPTQAQSNTDLLQKQLDAQLALEARLLAERAQKPQIAFPKAVLMRKSVPETAAAMLDQQRQFLERKRTIDAQIAILNQRIEQTNRDVAGKLERQSSLKSQHASMQGEINAVSGLAARGFYPRNKLKSLERELFRLEGELGLVKGDINRSHEIIEESRLQMKLARQRQVEEASLQLAEVRIRLSDIREKLQVAADILSRVDVRAPQDGIVQAIKVHAVGAVVRPGEALAEIVTLEDGLILTARIDPKDIDGVHADQHAEIRFASLMRKQRQAVVGKVLTVSADAMFDEALKQHYYHARVSIDPTTLPDDFRAKMVPGMPATVLIVGGERTFLSYLVSPLWDSITRTMRER
jgi:HlyD family secretion protein